MTTCEISTHSTRYMCGAVGIGPDGLQGHLRPEHRLRAKMMWFECMRISMIYLDKFKDKNNTLQKVR